MQFIANGLNGNYLSSILPGETVEVDSVLAAVAYGSDERTLIQNCLENRRRLDIWMRYDHTVPVSIPLLNKFLQYTSRNIFCYQVPDVLHSKVIWWKGYGAYIGSANLSDRAWFSNIEAGVFLDEGDLQSNGMVDEIEMFFESLSNLKEAFPLTSEIVSELEKMQQIRKSAHEIDKKAKSARTIDPFEGVSFFQKKLAKDKRKDAFYKEWHETLSFLRSISDLVTQYRPVWVAEDVPAAWQADQFLHAYYYNHVREGHSYPVDELYQTHKSNPSAAVKTELNWWKTLREPPTHEDVTFEQNAPFIQQVLSKDKLPNLSVDEFTKICRYTHATLDHVKKISLSTFGVAGRSMETTDRIPLFAEWLWNQRNSHNMTVKEILQDILYGGEESKIWERLYKYGREREFKLPHYGLNSLAELVGWARPDIMPPRNGRTSKALKALGYGVTVY